MTIKNFFVLSAIFGVLCIQSELSAVSVESAGNGITGQYSFADAATLNRNVSSLEFYSPDVRTQAIANVANKTLTRDQVKDAVQQAMNEVMLQNEIFVPAAFYNVDNMANNLISAASKR